MTKSKKYYFMYLNAIASSFAVVVAHTITNPAQLGITKIGPTFYVILCIVLGIVFSFGVPIFFMQSGANILNYRERYDTKTFFIKRIHKVVIPFIIWSIFGFFFIYGKSDFSLTLKSFITTFLSGSIVGPYWFFYNIIGFYLCVPFISLIIKYASRNIIKYTILVLLVVNTGIPIINILTKSQSLFSTSFPFIGPYAQYFIAGWYFAHNDISRRTHKQIYILGIIMLFFEIIATIYFSSYVKQLPGLNYPGGIVKTFFDIAMLPSFCVMCALFLIFKQTEPKLQKSDSFRKYFAQGAGLTFGIYLLHPFIITWLLVPFNNYLTTLPLLIKMVIDPIFVYLLSGVITFLIRKMKYLRWLMP